MASLIFDKNKTLIVSGVSKLLHDEIAKALQQANSTGFRGNVERIFVCPGGKDHALVEFNENIPGYEILFIFFIDFIIER